MRNIKNLVSLVLVVCVLVVIGWLATRQNTTLANAIHDNATAEATQSGVPSIEEAKQIALNAKWAKSVSLEFDDQGNVIMRGDGIPDHEYLDTYLAVSIIDNKSTYPVKLQPQHMKLVLPLQPKLADKKTAVEKGLIGITISGGLVYGPYEADGKTLALPQKDLVIDGLRFIDACNGHPNPFGVQYHYHGVPYCVTDLLDKPGEPSHLLGYLLDGYPLYGPQGANGVKVTPADLDECNGMFGPTPEFPEGVYHYVITEEPPYTMPCLSGVVEISSSAIGLFTRGTDPSYPPPPMPPAALMPPGLLPTPNPTSSK